ncbi:PA14 domain-containing protein [Desulfatirhabdium butyrativorans]|uniref:PA14 domain-containing protein n=1 Tax=Desulfatirhabdium butyrativorans TaxID=340467 RepID=UPI00146FC7F1|nr:PA14 domain-containing protein [Desulfatirhabdium butyrativorans]
MKKFAWQLQLNLFSLFVFALALALAPLTQGNERACAAESPSTFTLAPAGIQPADLAPGLDTRIIDKLFSTINQMPEDVSFSKGKPIAKLDYQYDGSAPMFGTDRNQSIGLVISGFLKFDPAGRYEIKAKSNDGIRIKLADKIIIEDPDVHSDRFSSVAILDAPQAGFVPLRIQYFQRKGSACLQLYWKRPGSDHFDIIPEEAYWRTNQP